MRAGSLSPLFLLFLLSSPEQKKGKEKRRRREERGGGEKSSLAFNHGFHRVRGKRGEETTSKNPLKKERKKKGRKAEGREKREGVEGGGVGRAAENMRQGWEKKGKKRGEEYESVGGRAV